MMNGLYNWLCVFENRADLFLAMTLGGFFTLMLGAMIEAACPLIGEIVMIIGVTMTCGGAIIITWFFRQQDKKSRSRGDSG